MWNNNSSSCHHILIFWNQFIILIFYFLFFIFYFLFFIFYFCFLMSTRTISSYFNFLKTFIFSYFIFFFYFAFILLPFFIFLCTSTFLFSFHVAASTRVGNSLGADQPDRARMAACVSPALTLCTTYTWD